jgi:hypothetical protein
VTNPQLQRLVADYRAFCNLARQAESWGLPHAAQCFRLRAQETAKELIRLHHEQQEQYSFPDFLPFPTVPWPPPPPNAA